MRVFTDPSRKDIPAIASLRMHDGASQAAGAARCAGQRHRFWELRHLLVLNQNRLGRDYPLEYARQVNLDVSAFADCIDAKRYDATIVTHAADAAETGITRTPTFIIGRTLQKGRFQGIKIAGAQPYIIVESKICELLAQSNLAAEALKSVM